MHSHHQQVKKGKYEISIYDKNQYNSPFHLYQRQLKLKLNKNLVFNCFKVIKNKKMQTLLNRQPKQ